jgi:hypothetical protein
MREQSGALQFDHRHLMTEEREGCEWRLCLDVCIACFDGGDGKRKDIPHSQQPCTCKGQRDLVRLFICRIQEFVIYALKCRVRIHLS